MNHRAGHFKGRTVRRGGGKGLRVTGGKEAHIVKKKMGLGRIRNRGLANLLKLYVHQESSGERRI